MITSPVDGTVVARDVSVGQTVAASLQTPTLFAIAQDLTKMQVDINVGEPDIGNVKSGDTVDFSVLAYPNRTFHGTVAEVRINPQTVNNVVTYDVVVKVDNTDGALLPGMTANASIDVANAKNALVVPIAALQWNPGAGHAAAAGSGVAQSAWGSTQAASTANAVTSGSTGAIFVQGNGRALVRVPVQVTLATNTQAAVVPVAQETRCGRPRRSCVGGQCPRIARHCECTAGHRWCIGGRRDARAALMTPVVQVQGLQKIYALRRR